ncbi:MAG TPA: histidine kinase, partial [Pseudomonas sp.]|nr:histidine kinase [Pseudomonas sp.]
MSALWRINLLVVLFFSLVTAICMAMLLRQAGHDVRRELTAAQAVVEYLQQAALRDPGSLDAGLAGSLRHVRVRWLDGDLVSPVPAGPLDAWLGAWLYAMPANAEPLRLTNGRQVQIAVDPSDEIEEVSDSLLQLLQLFGLALLFSLLVIRWGVRQGLRVLDDLLAGLHQVAQGRLQVRLPAYSRHESQLLAGHFNSMVATLEQVQADNGELTQALLTLQEHERKHLALALHDDLGQYLSGIRAQLLLLRSMTSHSDEVGQTLHRLEGNC